MLTARVVMLLLLVKTRPYLLVIVFHRIIYEIYKQTRSGARVWVELSRDYKGQRGDEGELGNYN